jgi:methylthioribose-1-phosphate isomerase
LIVDSCVSHALKKKEIDVIIVGADRICMNGDTANKIGTYNIAISAKYHNVPFYVAAPTTTIDMNLKSGDLIEIEERSEDEILFNGKKERVVCEGVDVFNPSFDVTPFSLITGIITEYGVITKNENGVFDIENFLKNHL